MSSRLAATQTAPSPTATALAPRSTGIVSATAPAGSIARHGVLEAVGDPEVAEAGRDRGGAVAGRDDSVACSFAGSTRKSRGTERKPPLSAHTASLVEATAPAIKPPPATVPILTVLIRRVTRLKNGSMRRTKPSPPIAQTASRSPARPIGAMPVGIRLTSRRDSGRSARRCRRRGSPPTARRVRRQRSQGGHRPGSAATTLFVSGSICGQRVRRDGDDAGGRFDRA